MGPVALARGERRSTVFSSHLDVLVRAVDGKLYLAADAERFALDDVGKNLVDSEQHAPRAYRRDPVFSIDPSRRRRMSASGDKSTGTEVSRVVLSIDLLKNSTPFRCGRTRPIPQKGAPNNASQRCQGAACVFS